MTCAISRFFKIPLLATAHAASLLWMAWVASCCSC